MLTFEHRYSKPEVFSVVTVPLPKLRDNDVLIKVKYVLDPQSLCSISDSLVFQGVWCVWD